MVDLIYFCPSRSIAMKLKSHQHMESCANEAKVYRSDLMGIGIGFRLYHAKTSYDERIPNTIMVSLVFFFVMTFYYA